MSNWKAMIILLTVGLRKKISLYKTSYFPERYNCSKNKIKAELDLSNRATKSELKNVTYFDRSKFAKEADLTNLKPDINDLDIDKSKTAPVDLYTLSNVVEKQVFKRVCMMKWLKLMLFRLLILVI